MSFNNNLLEKGEVYAKNFTGNKRRFPLKINWNSKRIRNKIQRNNYRKFPYENNLDDNLKFMNNFNDEQDDQYEDKEYCIPSCLLGRRYREANDLMIRCDICINWYHPKCIKMTDEEFEMLKKSDWSCGDCQNKN